MKSKETIFGLIKITNKLAKLLNHETELLKKFKRPSEIRYLQEEKAQLSAAYENDLALVTASSVTLKKEAPEEMDLLTKAIKMFKLTLDDHNRALFAAKTVTERMIQAISDEASKINQPPPGYSSYAILDKNKRKNQPVSIAINEVI
tara:strand:- start:62 stop:502 length:441 start_codon:yes stop_codon:yes gene_type:complete